MYVCVKNIRNHTLSSHYPAAQSGTAQPAMERAPLAALILLRAVPKNKKPSGIIYGYQII